MRLSGKAKHSLSGVFVCRVSDKQLLATQTRSAFIVLRILSTPFWCLLSLMVFILYKQAHLTSLQITLLIALKPTSSLLSPYWSQAIHRRPDKLLTNLAGANFLRHLPFLGLLFIDSSWYLISAFGVYMTLTRALIPAWMELVKSNLPKLQREAMVSSITTIDFLGTALFAVGAGLFLDHYPTYWKGLFVLSALLGMLSTLCLLWTPAPCQGANKRLHTSSVTLPAKCIKPWKAVWRLVRQRPDFLIFQIGFMLGGSGLMIMQPAFPRLFVDTFHLSFTEMGLALSLCKGIGVALTASLWTRLFRKVNLFQLSALVTLCATLFPFLLLATSFQVTLLYVAYIFYGVMQSGSELSWHMSGLVFAQERDSSTFSITNVLTVGLRGCLIPTLGALLLPSFHAVGVILLGALLCLLASCYFFFNRKTVARQVYTNGFKRWKFGKAGAVDLGQRSDGEAAQLE